MRKERIEIEVGGGPREESSLDEFWAIVYIVDGSKEQFSSKDNRRQADTYFSKNKKLAIKKAVDQAEYLCDILGLKGYEIVDLVEDKEDLNNTGTVESMYRGKV